MENMNVVCIGMAGSGKSTFINSFSEYLSACSVSHSIFNLDPAVINLPYASAVDIRQHINFKEIMKTHNLGPNGAIITCLNMFSIKFPEILESSSKSESMDIIDTPGQIEVFTWSASGHIIAKSLELKKSSLICYIVDTPRCASPATFMSNMLYACSIYYRFNLPFVIIFNKMDVETHGGLFEWLSDYSKFQEAISLEDNYLSDLMQSMGLVLEEFYSRFAFAKVSSITGAGMDDVLSIIRQELKKFHLDEKGKRRFEHDLSVNNIERELEKL